MLQRAMAANAGGKNSRKTVLVTPEVADRCIKRDCALLRESLGQWHDDGKDADRLFKEEQFVLNNIYALLSTPASALNDVLDLLGQLTNSDLFA